MPRNGSGTYTLPNAAFVPGTAISSADVNENFADIAAELTDSLSRTGDGGMTVPFQNTPGTEAAPGITFVGDTDTGIYRVGANVIGVSVGSNEVLEIDGTRTTIQNRSLFLDRGVALSTYSSNDFTGTTATATDVVQSGTTNVISVAVTTYGQPVVIRLVADGTSSPAYVGAADGSGTGASATLLLVRDSTVIARQTIGGNIAGATSYSQFVPPGSVWVVDTPAAGTYTYKLQYMADSGTTYVYHCKLVVHDL